MIVGRNRDEEALAMLRMRCAGLGATQIGARFGITRNRVRTITNRILDADRMESGEDVTEAYWRPEAQSGRP